MEIGSEFWLDKNIKDNSNSDFLKKEKNDNIFFMSGRTAIDYALNLIIKYRDVKKVYFPSYCCQSMLTPFQKRNIEIEFYTVKFDNGKIIYDIDKDKDCDIFLAMNYFGFSINNMDKFIENFSNRGIIVLEDSTHSFLSKRVYNRKSDLVIASLRKWFPIICGGILINVSKKISFDHIAKLSCNMHYVDIKKNAMIKKEKYINSLTNIKKEDFLENFFEANKILENDYINYKIDDLSYSILKNINIENVKEERIKNASAIYRFLMNQSEFEYIEEFDNKNDCPIFVPIFFKDKEIRDSIKKDLIKNNIYCPTHWGIPEIIRKREQHDIYGRELSLICDQRYNIDDIQKYIKFIKQ